MKQLLITGGLILLCSVSFSCKNNSTQPESTFEGITETSVEGPTPIGNIDPDDWKPMMHCPSFVIAANSAAADTAGPISTIPACTEIFPAYPNPADKSFIVSFSVNEADSILLTLNSTPSKVVKEVMKQRVMAGTYSITVDGGGLSPAVYRIYMFVFRPSGVLSSYGDVKIIN